jgi:molybdopterin/thiamine biosynthesis adenylyltransferase
MHDIHLRQVGFCSPAKLNEEISSTAIIGAGGIGSSAMIALAKMGLDHITVYDDDTLEAHNIGNQFLPFRIPDEISFNFLGRKKVWALHHLLRTLLPEDNTFTHEMVQEHFIPGLSGYGYLTICTVDSMKTRKELWNGAKASGKVVWYIDGRMGAQTLRIYVVNVMDQKSVEHYEASLYSDEDAEEAPCTERGIVYTSLFAGAHIANIVKQIAVGPQNPPMQLNHLIEHNLITTTGEVKRGL